MTTALKLSASRRAAFERMAADCRRVLGDRLAAVVATSPSTSVVFGQPFDTRDLDALGAMVETWHRDELDTPLLLTPEEFRRSLDTFPLEYQAMIDRHAVITGTPPFEGIIVAPSQLRRACEVQAKGHLIHLRQGWLEAAGRDDALAALLTRSSGPLRTLLANVSRLHGAPTAHGGDAPLDGARLAGLPDALIRSILALDEAPHHAGALVRQLPEYLAASERLWAFVDRWPIDQ